jgi:hypothetical protein
MTDKCINEINNLLKKGKDLLESTSCPNLNPEKNSTFIKIIDQYTKCLNEAALFRSEVFKALKANLCDKLKGDIFVFYDNSDCNFAQKELEKADAIKINIATQCMDRAKASIESLLSGDTGDTFSSDTDVT